MRGWWIPGRVDGESDGGSNGYLISAFSDQKAVSLSHRE